MRQLFKKRKPALRYIVARLREPSTWAAIAALAAALGVPPWVVAAAGALVDLAPDAVDAVAVVVPALVAVVLAEKGGDS